MPCALMCKAASDDAPFTKSHKTVLEVARTGAWNCELLMSGVSTSQRFLSAAPGADAVDDAHSAEKGSQCSATRRLAGRSLAPLAYYFSPPRLSFQRFH